VNTLTHAARTEPSLWDLFWDLLHIALGTIASVVTFWHVLRGASGNSLVVMLLFWIGLWGLISLVVVVMNLFSPQPGESWREFLKLNDAFIIAAFAGCAVFLFAPRQLLIGIMVFGASLPYIPKDTLGKFLEETLDILIFVGLYALVAAPILGPFWVLEGQPWREYIIFAGIYAVLKAPIVGELKRGLKRMYTLIVLTAFAAIIENLFGDALSPLVSFLPRDWQSVGLFAYFAIWTVLIELLITWQTMKVKPWWARLLGPWAQEFIDALLYPWRSYAYDAILSDTSLTIDEVSDNTMGHVLYVIGITLMALFPSVLVFSYLLRWQVSPLAIAIVPFGVFYVSAFIIAFLTKSLGE
jgi:hypothetical protein